MPSIHRAIQPLLLSALLLIACGDEGQDQNPAGNTPIRFVAPIQFTDCEIEFDVCCGECPDKGVLIPFCSGDTIWERGEEWLAFIDLPSAELECTVSVSIQRGEITCDGSETFQVVLGRQVMVDIPVTCSP